MFAGLLALAVNGCLTDSKKNEGTVPSITSDPNSLEVYEGASAQFTLVATGTAPLTYQWIRGSSTVVAGATKDTLNLMAVQLADDGSTFKCVVKNAAGADTSAAATLHVTALKPVITEQPTDQTVAFGDTVTFTIAATGVGPLSYYWVLNGDTLGEDTPILTGVPPASYDGASINCVVSNSAGSVVSNTVTLHVVTTPWPAEVTISVGAQGNPILGTAIDLDVPEVLLSATANQRQEDLDLLFVFSGGGYNLMSPMAAKSAAFAVAAGYDDNRIWDTQFVRVAEKPSSQEAAFEAYLDGDQIDSAPVVVGDMLIVYTSDNHWVYLKIESLAVAGTAGSSSLAVSVGSI